jgi:hypothetical protein
MASISEVPSIWQECVSTLQTGYPAYKHHAKIRGRACLHASHDFGPYLPVREGPDAVTYPTAPDLAFLLGRALVCWWANLARVKKPDCPVCQTGVCDFGSFRTKLRNELNLKIWRSNVFWSKKRDQDWRKSSKKLKSQKSDHLVCQTRLSDFLRTNGVWLGFMI